MADLESDKTVQIERGQLARKSLFDVLGDKGVPKAQIYRILKALEPVRTFDKTGKRDRFTVALDRATRRARAFEYEVSAAEIYQAREGDDGLLTGQKLDMKLADGEMVGAFYVSTDITRSYEAGGFEDGILAALDDALAGHMSTEAFEEGGTVRVIAVEETALGMFARYKNILAMEYRPPDPAAKPVRIYAFNGEESHGYWDERGRQPYAGGWRSPCPGAPVTSRFNPKRMHPILHKIMPHQGTDFGAPMGTPVYAAYKGVVTFVGPHGPTGNWVGIDHPGGIETGYAHLSRFAPGLKVGDKIGTHQLVGYVGSTGRSTGPHLHFSARRNGVFFDAETLRLDGDRAVPIGDRAGFLATKAEPTAAWTQSPCLNRPRIYRRPARWPARRSRRRPRSRRRTWTACPRPRSHGERPRWGPRQPWRARRPSRAFIRRSLKRPRARTTTTGCRVQSQRAGKPRQPRGQSLTRPRKRTKSRRAQRARVDGRCGGALT